MESKTHKENVLNKKERDSTLFYRDKRRAKTNIITAANGSELEFSTVGK